tara:strand:+ start:981 stop:2099 length:1119 start_codon:yes stop_codon:yes gene_type:complete
MMGIAGIPRNTAQGPLNVPRETLPHFQQGGGLFSMAPAPAVTAQPNFNLNLASQALTDPRGPYVPPSSMGYFAPTRPDQSLPGLRLVDPATVMPKEVAPVTGEIAPVGVGSPDTMYGSPSQIGSSLDLMGAAFVPDPEQAFLGDEAMIAKANQRQFDNAMDTAMDRASKAQAMNVLYGGMTALPGGESTKNAFTESQAGIDAEQARIDFLDSQRTMNPNYPDRANLREDYNRMLAGETTGVSGRPLLELGIVNPFEGPALMAGGVPSPVFSNYDPALAAEFDYSPENIQEILNQAEYRGPIGMTPNQTGMPSTPLDMDELQKSDPARFNAIMSAMGINPDPNAVPYIAPIDFSRGAAQKAEGGGIMSLNPNY